MEDSTQANNAAEGNDSKPGLWSKKVRWRGLLHVAGAFACLGTVLMFFARLGWPFELFSHFTAQYLVGLIVIAAVLGIAREKRGCAIFCAFAGVNLAVVAPRYFGGDRAQATAGSKNYRMISANVQTSNREYGRLLELVKRENPDFILILEVDKAWMAALKELDAEYAYSISAPHEDNFGIAFYSKTKPERLRLLYPGEAQVRVASAEMNLDGARFTILGVHTVPPTLPYQAHLRDDEMEDVAKHVSSLAHPAIVAGDLNMTPWSPVFKDFLQTAGMRDSLRGRGLQPSWPAGSPLMWIALDHFLYRPGIIVRDRRVGPAIGSDHYPLIVDFAVNPDA